MYDGRWWCLNEAVMFEGWCLKEGTPCLKERSGV